ncbi:hypothetical protein F4810DRAFT_713308 [Camillea tinctor]|nr:hypothetical protein F4810DRAFT_713308 [Camillea tinctor]
MSYPLHKADRTHVPGNASDERIIGNNNRGANGNSPDDDDEMLDQMDLDMMDDMDVDTNSEISGGSYEEGGSDYDSSPDDVDLLGGDPSLDRPTLGIELEFMLAVCPNTFHERVVKSKDPHPSDPRWCSKTLGAIDWTEEYGPNGEDLIGDNETRLRQACRNKLTRILRNVNLTVVKVPDEHIDIFEQTMSYVEPTTFSETDDSDDETELPYPNSDYLDNFVPPPAIWDPDLNNGMNALTARSHFITEFVNYHVTHNLRLHRTSTDDIDDFGDRLPFSGPWTQNAMDMARAKFGADAGKMIWEEKRSSERRRNTQRDPLHVDVAGIQDRYRSWTVTADFSVDGNGMVASRYQIPAHRRGEEPMEEYIYFGAEVVSPVLPANVEATYDAIRRACAALRDTLRIHKPMQVSTGFHVHLGHLRGWNLLQLKRFATLWFLTEDFILHLHRVDRGTDNKWCARIGEGTQLWAALNSNNRRTWTNCSDVLPRVADGPIKDQFRASFEANVPIAHLDAPQINFLWHLWQLSSITRLAQALTGYEREEDRFCIRTGLRWRLFGRKNTPAAVADRGTQTVEVRIMQGTLDADHINNWIAILVHVVAAVRNWSADDFQRLLAGVLVEPPDGRARALFALLGVPQGVVEYWADQRRRDERDEWWEYPDKDRVDWDNPFMVPGHRATHGAAWD